MTGCLWVQELAELFETVLERRQSLCLAAVIVGGLVERGAVARIARIPPAQAERGLNALAGIGLVTRIPGLLDGSYYYPGDLKILARMAEEKLKVLRERLEELEELREIFG